MKISAFMPNHGGVCAVSQERLINIFYGFVHGHFECAIAGQDLIWFVRIIRNICFHPLQLKVQSNAFVINNT